MWKWLYNLPEKRSWNQESGGRPASLWLASGDWEAGVFPGFRAAQRHIVLVQLSPEPGRAPHIPTLIQGGGLMVGGRQSSGSQ